jgi:hypothetical protein
MHSSTESVTPLLQGRKDRMATPFATGFSPGCIRTCGKRPACPITSSAIRKIIEQTGHFPVDLGALDVGGPLASLPFGSLATVNFIKI